MENSPSTMAVAVKDFEDSLQYTLTSCTKSTVHVKCLWTISNFKEVRDKMKKGERIDSSESLTFFSGNFNYHFTFYPKGTTHFEGPKSAIYLVQRPDTSLRVWVLNYFAIKDRDGNLHFERFGILCIMDKQRLGSMSFTPCDFPDRENEEKFLPNGNLQVFIEGTFWKEHRYLEDENYSWFPATTTTISTLSLENLLRSGEASDFELVIDKNKFKVHKNILSSRSLFFKDMFKKCTLNKAFMNGLRPDVFREVLYFMYTDTVSVNVKSMLADTLEVANFFGIGLLKDFCIAEMIDSISYENVITYFLVSRRGKARELRTKCINFMIKNIDTFSKRPEWKLFNDEHKDLANSLEKVLVIGKLIPES